MSDLSKFWTPFQVDFWERRDDPFVIASCGVSSGKTRIGAWWVVRELLKGKRNLVGCQSFTALSRVMFMEIVKILDELGVSYAYNKSAKEIRCRDSDGVIFGYTGENPGGVLGLSEIHNLLLDEASYCPEEAYLWAADRCRGEPRQLQLHAFLVHRHGEEQPGARDLRFGAGQPVHEPRIQGNAPGALPEGVSAIRAADSWPHP